MDLALALADLDDQQRAVVARRPAADDRGNLCRARSAHEGRHARKCGPRSPRSRAALRPLSRSEQKVAIFYKLGPQEAAPKQGAAILFCNCSTIDPECNCWNWRCSWMFGCGMSGGETCDGVCS